MSPRRILVTVAGGSARRPWLVLVLAAVLGLGAAVLALRLHPTAATSTFVSSSSPEYRATQGFYDSFGEEPITILVKGNLQQLVLSSDIDRLLGLEGCLSGNVPASALAAEGGPRGPCGELARARTVKVVFGPGTFINEAAEQINQQLTIRTRSAQVQAAQAQRAVQAAALARGLPRSQAVSLGERASKVTIARYQEELVTLALKYGLTARPSIDEPNFVSTLVFDPASPAGTPKQRFAYLFPSSDSALISVRMKAGLSEAQRTHTIALIRGALAMPQWQLQHGGSYLLSGEPVIVADLTESITHAIELLLVAVLIVMAATLALVFLGRPRLLPLMLALLAAAITFGGLSLAGGSLSIATIAVLPVLIGLAVDYSVQFQSRASEALSESAAPGESEAEGRVRAVVSAATVGAPTIVAAGLSSSAAILVLLLSPVPMVRGFGVLLVVGLAVALACALTVGAAALAVAGRPRSARAEDSLVGARIGAAWRGARELLLENPLTRLLGRVALGFSVRRPERVLCIGLALAVIGWGLDTQTKVQTDITKLVPQSLSSLRSLRELERTTGVGGQINVMIRGKDVATPATITWMSRYEAAVLARFGYTQAHGCAHARLCPVFSLPDLFSGHASGSSTPALNATDVEGLLSTIPPYFSQDVITPDRRVASLSFGVRLAGLDQSQQEQLVQRMRAALHPPAGIHADIVGLTVLAAASGSKVADPWRRLETLLVAIAVVALVMSLAFREDRRRRVLAPLAPIVLATGWSALILFLVRVPLNPMSVTLGPLVIAVSTEFSVLLSERHRQERLAGHDTIQALARTYRRTGAAVAASGATAIAGFGVLAFSDIRMLRDFGLVTLIDLTVSLIGVLVALPAALVIAEREGSLRVGVSERLRALRMATVRAGRAGDEPA